MSSSVGEDPSTRATRVSPLKQRAYVDFPRHTTSVSRGMRKYSTVRASANEFGGMMQTSPPKSTKLRSSNAFGSTIVLLMFVKILNSAAQRTS